MTYVPHKLAVVPMIMPGQRVKLMGAAVGG
jgi:hypothetical protein